SCRAPRPPALPSFPTRRSSDLLAKVASLVLLFLPLVFVKYGGFVADSLGVRETVPWLAAASSVLPAGISFFTFQAASYVLDVARSEEHTSELQSRENLVCRLLL